MGLEMPQPPPPSTDNVHVADSDIATLEMVDQVVPQDPEGQIKVLVTNSRSLEHNQRLRALQFMVSLGGASFKDSSRSAYIVQACVLVCQLGLAPYVVFEALRTDMHTHLGPAGKSKIAAWFICEMVIMCASMAFIHFATRNGEQSRAIVAAAKTFRPNKLLLGLTVAPLLMRAVVDICFTMGISETQGIRGVALLVYTLTVFGPTAIGTILAFVYAQSFTDSLPQESYFQDLKKTLTRYNDETQRTIGILNNAFLVPHLILWLSLAIVQFFILFDISLLGKDGYGWSRDELTTYFALQTFFDGMVLLTLLLPPAEYTRIVDQYARDLVSRYCEDYGNIGYITWLKDQKLHWILLSIRPTKKGILRVMYLVIVGGLTIISRYLTSRSDPETY